MFPTTPNPFSFIPDEIIVLLIREELRGRKLFHKLSELGITENFHYPSLVWLILITIDMNPNDDKLGHRYFEILDEHVERGEDIKEAGEVLRKLRQVGGK